MTVVIREKYDMHLQANQSTHLRHQFGNDKILSENLWIKMEFGLRTRICRSSLMNFAGDEKRIQMSISVSQFPCLGYFDIR